MNIQIRHLILRYGVFVLLVLMSAGMIFFVCSFELRVKTSIHLFYDGHEHCWHGYLSSPKNVGFQPQDTLLVVQTSMGDISYIVESIVTEPGMLHITLQSLKKETFPNTYSEGFVYVGKEDLLDKILNKNLH